MLQVKDIHETVDRAGALPVYQLAMLDFLNRAKSPEDIAGPQYGPGPIADDPTRGAGRHPSSRGYDIGEKVAARILEHRAKLGGRFTALEQLSGIPYFGTDKFNDLVYTFLNLRSPIPTGLGIEFDQFIGALGALELSLFQTKKSPQDILTAIRKIVFDQQTRGEATTPLQWDDIFPTAKDVRPPLSWGLDGKLVAAAQLIRSKVTVKVGPKAVDVGVLLAGLDARNRSNPVYLPELGIELPSNLEFATFLHGIGNGAYQHLSKDPNGTRTAEDKNLILSHYQRVYSPAALLATADAWSMELDGHHSLSWNLLNYYTKPEGAVKHRYAKFAEQLGLGTVEQGFFTGDTEGFRRTLLDKAKNASFKSLADAGDAGMVREMLDRRENSPQYQAYSTVTAFLSDRFLDDLLLQVSMEINKPAILSWNRLEARPRTKDFSRALRAEVRDPLWFLSRQWQFGEFEGEDAGSSVEMRVDMETSQVDRYSIKQGLARPYSSSIPMETIVERELIDFDLTLSQEMGRHWERLARKHLSQSPGGLSNGDIDTILKDFKRTPSLQFHYVSAPDPKDDVTATKEIKSDPTRLKVYAAIGGGRMLDGGALYKLLKAGTTADSFVSSFGADANRSARLASAAAAYITWLEKVYNQPASTDASAWAPSSLEYQFQCSAPASAASTTVLTAEQYASGRLEWYSFDLETKNANSDPTLRNAPRNTDLIERRVLTLLPGDLRFPGMPLARWWEMEDWKVDLGDIVADVTDVPRLLQAEFALIYSNDWMLLPQDVKVGSICNVKSIIVKDVFGQYTSVKAAGAGDDSDWQRWSMFNLHRRDLVSGAADTRLFVPPSVIKTMESDPLESVTLVRDEMANLVWGIETLIPDGFGGGMDGTEAATRLSNYMATLPTSVPPSPANVPNDAQIQYLIGTSVPENWIPFIAMRKGGVTSRQIQLRRAAMPRLIPGLTPERIRPRTDLLKQGYTAPDTWAPYFIHEEEVPRSGLVLKRTWQRVRWMDGTVYTWLGRRASVGRGEVNSGLEYDLIKERG